MPDPILKANQPLRDDSLRIIEFLGSGSYGIVWKARLEFHEELCAVKEVEVRDTAVRERIVRECRIGRELRKTPGILGIDDVFLYQEEHVIIIMELMEQHLGRRLRAPVSFEQALDWCITLCQALGEIHRRDIIHRDIKPQNILLDAKDRAYLGDFGIAHIPYSSLTGRTQPGTPPYTAPEIDRGDPITAAADVYALCAVFFTIWCGRWDDGLKRLDRDHLHNEGVSGIAGSHGAAPEECRELLIRAIIGGLEHDAGQRSSLDTILRNIQQVSRLFVQHRSQRPKIKPDNLESLSQLTVLGSSRIHELAVSPDGYTLAIATSAGIEVWSTASSSITPEYGDRAPSTTYRTASELLDPYQFALWTYVGTITTEGTRVKALAWRTWGRILAALLVDGAVRVWQFEVDEYDRAEVTAWNEHLVEQSAPATAIAWGGSNNVLTMATDDGSIVFLEQQEVRSASAEAHTDTDRANDEDDLDIEDEAPPEQFSTTTEYITVNRFQASEQAIQRLNWLQATHWGNAQPLLASVEAETSITIWDNEGKKHTTIPSRDSAITSIAWSAARQLIVGYKTGEIVSYAEDGSTQHVLASQNSAVTAIAVSRRSGWIAEATGYCQVRIWDSEWQLRCTIDQAPVSVQALAWDDDDLLLIGTDDGLVRAFDQSGLPFRPLARAVAYQPVLAWNPDIERQLLALAAADHTIRLVSADGILLRVLEGHQDVVNGLLWSPEGQTLISTSRDHTARLWDIDNPSPSIVLKHPDIASDPQWDASESAFSVLAGDLTWTWSPDGVLNKAPQLSVRRIETLELSNSDAASRRDMSAYVTEDGTIVVSLGNGRKQAIAAREAPIVHLFGHPDAQSVFVVYADCVALLWDMASATGKIITEEALYTSRPAWSPDGQVLALALIDQRMGFWANNGEFLSFISHPGLRDVAVDWGPDGRTLALVSDEGTVQLWGIPQG